MTESFRIKCKITIRLEHCHLTEEKKISTLSTFEKPSLFLLISGPKGPDFHETLTSPLPVPVERVENQSDINNTKFFETRTMNRTEMSFSI